LLALVLIFEITQSAEKIVVATDTAFFSAVFVTNTGSIIPAFTILITLPEVTSIPFPATPVKSSVPIPAFSSIVLNGA
jgi:hypothetical protein